MADWSLEPQHWHLLLSRFEHWVISFRGEIYTNLTQIVLWEQDFHESLSLLLADRRRSTWVLWMVLLLFMHWMILSRIGNKKPQSRSCICELLFVPMSILQVHLSLWKYVFPQFALDNEGCTTGFPMTVILQWTARKFCNGFSSEKVFLMIEWIVEAVDGRWVFHWVSAKPMMSASISFIWLHYIRGWDDHCRFQIARVHYHWQVTT